MITVSLKLPSPLASRLADTARVMRMSKSAVIRDALEAYLSANDGTPEKSALSLAGDAQGVLAGPEDLSFNKKHLRDFAG